jgi:predicted nucleic acid-binding protein
MKNMESKILIDTNILLDYFLKREPFFQDSKEIITLCKNNTIKGCIASHTVSNMFFILRNEYTVKERRALLIGVCSIFDVIGIDKNNLISGLNNENFSDFEDCLQAECAKEFGAQYIVTRNVKDFAPSMIEAVTPSDFLCMYSK